VTEQHKSTIARIWSSVLSVDHVVDTDDFLARGGDSMAAIRLISDVCAELDVSFAFHEFLKNPTFGTLCRVVGESLRSDTPSDGHQMAVVRAERAATELLQSRPFHDNSVVKQTIAIAAAMSVEPSAALDVPHRDLIKSLLEAT
jgi:acyl carrier protein